MVRLTKDAASEPVPVRARVRAVLRSLVQMRTAMGGMAQTVARVAEVFSHLQAQPRPRWEDQFPVYRCPYRAPLWSLDGVEPETCDATWNRLQIPTADLRMQVWDHIISAHVPGEHGFVVAGNITSQIMEGPWTE